MKIEGRFLIIISSLLLGCLGGWLYFEAGDLFCTTGTQYRGENDFLSFMQHKQSDSLEPSETHRENESTEVIAQMRSSVNETLYQHTARLEAEKEKKKVEFPTQVEPQSPATDSVSTPVAAGGGSPEAVHQNVLNEMAEASAPLAESLRALDVTRNQPFSPSRPEGSTEQVADSGSRPANPPALFRVRDFEQNKGQQAPSLGLSIVSAPDSHSTPEGAVDFQMESSLEARKALSSELVSQLPVSPGAGDQLEPATVSQALGNRMELPPPATAAEQPLTSRVRAAEVPATSGTTVPEQPVTEQPATEQSAVPVPDQTAGATESQLESSDDLDENPLATIMGLQPQEKEKKAEEEDKKSEESAGATDSGTTPEGGTTPGGETTVKTAPGEKQNAGAASENDESGKSQPTRMKKPVRAAGTDGSTGGEASESANPEMEFKLDLYRVDIRKALASFQIETGLKVVASLDVQGTVSCRAQNRNPEVLLGSLLADTSFQFVRNGNFVYIAHSERMENLPTPLEKTDTEMFVPKNISVGELEIIFRSNLSQFGKCERARDESGQEGLRVTDWVLVLEQLEDIQQVVDLPAPENRINAFVFQRELDGTFKALELVTIAEERGLVLQRLTIPTPGTEEDKKPVFTGGFGGRTREKKEKPEDIKVYSISYRAETLLVSIKDQLGTLPAPMPGWTSAPLELNQPSHFDFNLNVQNQIIPYRFTITFRQNSESDEKGNGEILADVVCAPREDLGPKAKPKPIQFTLPVPINTGNSLVCQFNLGEFPVESSDKRKNPAYAFHGNRMTKEAIVVICPFQQAAKLPRTHLSTQAIREIIRQQEVFGRKFYGSLDREEREKSAKCFAIAKRLRSGLGETTEPASSRESGE